MKPLGSSGGGGVGVTATLLLSSAIVANQMISVSAMYTFPGSGGHRSLLPNDELTERRSRMASSPIWPSSSSHWADVPSDLGSSDGWGSWGAKTSILGGSSVKNAVHGGGGGGGAEGRHAAAPASYHSESSNYGDGSVAQYEQPAQTSFADYAKSQAAKDSPFKNDDAFEPASARHAVGGGGGFPDSFEAFKSSVAANSGAESKAPDFATFDPSQVSASSQSESGFKAPDSFDRRHSDGPDFDAHFDPSDFAPHGFQGQHHAGGSGGGSLSQTFGRRPSFSEHARPERDSSVDGGGGHGKPGVTYNIEHGSSSSSYFHAPSSGGHGHHHHQHQHHQGRQPEGTQQQQSGFPKYNLDFTQYESEADTFKYDPSSFAGGEGNFGGHDHGSEVPRGEFDPPVKYEEPNFRQPIGKLAGSLGPHSHGHSHFQLTPDDDDGHHFAHHPAAEGLADDPEAYRKHAADHTKFMSEEEQRELDEAFARLKERKKAEELGRLEQQQPAASETRYSRRFPWL